MSERDHIIHDIVPALKSVQDFLNLLEEERFYLYPFEKSFTGAKESIQFSIEELEHCDCW